MYKPIRFDHDVPIFSRQDIDLYGLPEEILRIWRYQVVEAPSCKDYVLDFQTEQEHNISTLKLFGISGKYTKKHLYKRMDRFTRTMNNLLGHTPPPDTVIEVVLDELVEQNPETIWRDAAVILSRNSLSKYEEKIPYILKCLGFPLITSKHNPYDIAPVFEQMSKNFDALPESDRKYFPKMRYVCVRLLLERNVKFGYDIPLVKTPSRLVILNDLFNKIR